jgi:uncharacterized membrane protein YhaH (DUF805 family)
LWTAKNRVGIIRRNSYPSHGGDVSNADEGVAAAPDGQAQGGAAEWLARIVWFLFRFSGRTGRIAYFAGMVFVSAISVYLYFAVLDLLPWQSMLSEVQRKTETQIAIAIALVMPLGLWMTLAVGVKRAHDFNRSWGTVIALTVLSWIPYLGVVFAFVPVFWPGTKGPNSYGQGTGWKNRPL